MGGVSSSSASERWCKARSSLRTRRYSAPTSRRLWARDLCTSGLGTCFALYFTDPRILCKTSRCDFWTKLTLLFTWYCCAVTLLDENVLCWYSLVPLPGWLYTREAQKSSISTETLRLPVLVYRSTFWRYAVAQVVEALRYKPEGRGLYSRWSSGIFQVTVLPDALWPWGWFSL